MGYVSVGGLAFKPEFIRLKTTDSMSIVWNVPQDGVTYCFWRKVGIGNVYLFTSQTMGGMFTLIVVGSVDLLMVGAAQ